MYSSLTALETSCDSYDESEINLTSLQPRLYGVRVARRKAIFESLSTDISSTASSTSSECSPRLARKSLNASCRNFLAFQAQEKKLEADCSDVINSNTLDATDQKVSKLLGVLATKSEALEKANGDGRLDMKDIVAAVEKVMKVNPIEKNFSGNSNYSDKNGVHRDYKTIWKTPKKNEECQIMQRKQLKDKNIADNKTITDDHHSENLCNDTSNDCGDDEATKDVASDGSKNVNNDEKIKAIRLVIPTNGYKLPSFKHRPSFKICDQNVKKMTYSQYRGMLERYARRGKGERESEK